MESDSTGRHRSDGHSRRRFLRGVTALSATTGGSLLVGGAGAAESTDSPPVRRSVASLRRHDPDDVLPTFREAISRLRELPSSDPRHLANLVAIHGSRERFNECEHGNWAFLPWHRAYLHCFEELCRELTGNESFAVPYWNWIERPRLPGIFRGDDSEPLYDPTRTSVSTADSSIVGPAAIEPILRDPNFYRVIGGWAGTRAAGDSHEGGDTAADSRGDVGTADDGAGATAGDADTTAVPPATPAGPADGMHFGSGALEQPAHDYVHVRVGGNMATGASPADPCFWTHHSTLDWLWWEWNARGHPNADDPAWLTTAFDGEFVGRDGDAVERLTIADTLSLPGEAYTFDRRASFADGARAGPGRGTGRGDERGNGAGRRDGRRNGREDRTLAADGTAPPASRAGPPADRTGPPATDDSGVTADAVRAAQTATAAVDLERVAQTTLRSDVALAAGDSLVVATDGPVVETTAAAGAFEQVLAGETPGRLWLTGREIDLPARGTVVTSVFLEGAPGAAPGAPSEPALVGSWLYFRAPPMHPPQNYFVDVTEALRRRYARGALSTDEPLRFRLVAEPLTGQDAHGASITADRIDLEARQSVIDGAVVERVE